jgi:hypothetical protein
VPSLLLLHIHNARTTTAAAAAAEMVIKEAELDLS